VQGLTVGSPVKYLGIDIGLVKEIAPVDTVYKVDRHDSNNTPDRYVYVLMSIDASFFRSDNSLSTKELVNKDIALGLRVKMALQNVTGNAYLELDFLDPKKHPGLKTYWKPKHFYIPSTPSTLTFVKDQTLLLLEELKQIDFKKLFGNMQKFASSADKAASKFDDLLTHTNRQIIDTINNLHSISKNLNTLTEQAKNFPSYTWFGKPPPKLDPDKL